MDVRLEHAPRTSGFPIYRWKKWTFAPPLPSRSSSRTPKEDESPAACGGRVSIASVRLAPAPRRYPREWLWSDALAEPWPEALLDGPESSELSSSDALFDCSFERLRERLFESSLSEWLLVAALRSLADSEARRLESDAPLSLSSEFESEACAPRLESVPPAPFSFEFESSARAWR
jgi:hypothetical protein